MVFHMDGYILDGYQLKKYAQSDGKILMPNCDLVNLNLLEMLFIFHLLLLLDY